MDTGATKHEEWEKKLEKRLQDPKTEPLVSLPLDFLKDITSGFSTELGRGGYGVVYKGVLRSGKAIAVKKIHDEHLLGNEVENEILCLMEVSHQNVIQLVGYCVEAKLEVMKHSGKPVMVEKRACLLCFEFVSDGSLDKHLSDDTSVLDWDKRYKIIWGICRGLHYLHDECHIVHLDLKPQNILMDATRMPKIADFGLSRLWGEQKSNIITKSRVGTPGYMAQEYLVNGIISFKADIFSLGVIIIQIITGSRDYPYTSNTTETSLYTEEVIGSWRNRLIEITPTHIQQVQQCIYIALECLAESNERPTSLDIVQRLNALEPKCTSPGNPPSVNEKAQASNVTSLAVGNTSPGGGRWWRIRSQLTCRIQRCSIKNIYIIGLIIFFALVVTLARLFLINSVMNLGPHAQDSTSSSPTLAGKLPGSSSSGRSPLDVVIVYAFDCTDYTAAWYTVDDVFWLVQEKLTHFVDSRMGYIYVKLASNTYRSDMKLVDSSDTQAAGGYKTVALRTGTCRKNMASGLAEAHKMLTDRRYHQNGTILLFSDGLSHKGDFFDGAENFVSEVPVHTFTLGGDTYNQGLHAIAANSPGGIFHTAPVPGWPGLSGSFLRLLDTILGVTTLDGDKPPTPSLGWEPLDVVILYAFDCTHSTPAWYTMDDVFWLVQQKLTHFVDSCLGYIYPRLAGNTYTSDLKLVNSAETKDTGYTKFAEHTIGCTKNMASGLAVAHKMINNRGYKNGSIMLFSNGLIHKGDFFDGAENFISKVPVHTFTLGGNASNPSLQAIAKNSPGGTFNPIPVPEKSLMSTYFSELLDTLLIRGQ